MQITQETTDRRELRHGHVAVGLSAVQLTNSFLTFRGVLIRSDDSNTASVYIGTANVRADNSESGGVPLPAGQSIVIPIADPSGLFLISTDTDQDISWLSL
jgi:hypothetical protein